MANVQKYTKAACGHMFKHYERARELNPETGQLEYAKFGNQQINPERSHLNYNLAAHQTMRQGDFIRKRCSEVKLQNRKDVNVMCSWVLTAPKDLPETEQADFFKASYEFMANRYGRENVISAYVHLDEASPHVHFAFIPVAVDKKRGGYKVSAKEVINKHELQVFHQELSKHLEKALGHSVGVLNGETKGGNKTIAELKEKRARERAEKAEEQATAAEVKLVEANAQYE
ncbi:MAG: plasmid recombination protein, partial [Oscillospiraceae bacterium]|nr:plasmid recombination protein [Oscillospiraceae bacterium]